MDFALTDEQEMVVDTVRAFTERELVPYENEVEHLNDVPPDLVFIGHQLTLGKGPDGVDHHHLLVS